MFTEQIFYGVRCDRCGEMYESSGDYSYMSDKGEIWEQAWDEGWNEHNGHHYCPCCHKVIGKDENEGNIIRVKNGYPQCVQKLKLLLRLLVGHSPRNEEREGWLHYNVPLQYKGVLSDLSRQMIERTLNEVVFTIDFSEDNRGYRYADIAIMLKEFKVGDRVKIIRHSDYRDAFGKEGEVIEVHDGERRPGLRQLYAVHIFDDDDPKAHFYDADWMELVK